MVMMVLRGQYKARSDIMKGPYKVVVNYLDNKKTMQEIRIPVWMYQIFTKEPANKPKGSSA